MKLKSTLSFCLAAAGLLSLSDSRAVAAEPPATAPAKLLEPKPLSPGHRVVTLFPPGHPALRAGPGSDQDEKFNPATGRVSAVTNIHNPSIELYLAPPE